MEKRSRNRREPFLGIQPTLHDLRYVPLGRERTPLVAILSKFSVTYHSIGFHLLIGGRDTLDGRKPKLITGLSNPFLAFNVAQCIGFLSYYRGV